MDYIYSPWKSPGQSTGVVAFPFSRGWIFPTQGSNPGLPQCRQIIYQLSNKGSPRILEGVAYPFSSRSSWPRNWTGVSFIAGDSLPAELPGGKKKKAAQKDKERLSYQSRICTLLIQASQYIKKKKKKKERKGLGKLANQIKSEVRESAFSIVYKILRTELHWTISLKGLPSWH